MHLSQLYTCLFEVSLCFQELIECYSLYRHVTEQTKSNEFVVSGMINEFSTKFSGIENDQTLENLTYLQKNC